MYIHKHTYAYRVLKLICVTFDKQQATCINKHTNPDWKNMIKLCNKKLIQIPTLVANCSEHMETHTKNTGLLPRDH